MASVGKLKKKLLMMFLRTFSFVFDKLTNFSNNFEEILTDFELFHLTDQGLLAKF